MNDLTSIIRAIREMSQYREGYDAFQAGLLFAGNPYRKEIHADMNNEWLYEIAWASGWRDAESSAALPEEKL